MTKTVNALNLKNIVDDFRLLADRHKQLNSFGFGDLDEFSFQVDTRDKEANTSFQAPYYPYLYVIPANIIQEFGFMTYEFNLIVSDIMKRDMNNMTDILSDTLQIMNDVVSMFRLSVSEQLGNYNEYYFTDDPITMVPFIEQYEDLLCGYSATIRIKTKTYLDRCSAAFEDFPIETPCISPSPTPSITPTNTETPTQTPTPTNTETPTQTATNTATPTETPTQTATNTATPTETPTQTATNTPTETPTQTPTETPTQTTTNTSTPTNTPTQTQTPTNTETPTQTPTPTNTSTQTSTPSETPTQTPSETPTQTPTNTSTQTSTPSETPTQTPTNTQTQTPTNTGTPTQTPTNTNTGSPTPTPSSTPPPFSPSGLTNLQLWFLSTSGASVSSWTNYGLLGGSVSQAVGSRQPQIITGTLGSYTGQTVQYTDRDYMQGTFTSTNYSSSTVFSVMKVNGTDAQGWSVYLYSAGLNNFSWEWQSRAAATTSIVRKNPGSSTSAARTKAPLLLATSGTTGAFFTASFNDVLGTSGTTTYTGTTATLFDFGYEPGISTSTNIEVYEQLVYNRVLNATEYGNVINYLKTKYQYNTW